MQDACNAVVYKWEKRHIDKEALMSFVPHVPSDRKIKEFSFRAVFIGLLFGFFFAVANGYLGLKIGSTISASIPAAIMAMALMKVLFKDGTILENNLIQTIATVGEGLAAGIVYTIPALFLLGEAPSTGRIFLLSCLGGILGILFMIPMRRFVIVEEHKKLPFPEGTACAQILKAGEKSGKTAVMASWGFLGAAVYKIASNGLFLWKETPSWVLKFFKKTEFSLDATPALLGVGYIIGPQITSIMFAGGMIAWWMIIPLIKTFGLGDVAVYPSTVPIIDMSADAIWDSYVRYIGAGALAVGGLSSLVKVLPLLYRTARASFKELITLRKGRGHLERTDRDISMAWLILGAVAIILVLWLFPGLPMNLFTIILLVVLGFFFVAVTTITVGLVGTTSNPLSGMVITTLLITCAAFVLLGWTERVYLFSAITMGSVACCAICMAGTTAQDLKAGFLLGATPRSQQIAEILGTLLPSLSLGYVLYILNQAYQIGSTTMPAPQATLLSMIAKGVISGELPYGLFAIGIVLGIVIGIFQLPILPFALGVYLPLSLSTAMMVGGLARAYVNKYSNTEASQERGILFASGIVGGDACTGVVLALFAIFGVIRADAPPLLPNWVSLLAYLLFALALAIFSAKRGKKNHSSF